MKLYLAGPYAGRDIVRDLVPVFVQAGHVVVSKWLHGTRLIGPGTLGTSPASTNEECMEHAGMDFQDIDLADVLLHFTGSFIQGMDPTLGQVTHLLGSGGRHVETGYALAHHKSVIVLGAPENIFQRGLCHTAPTLADALDILDEMSEDWN